eukprot:m51a1_g6529 hypothetical protein (619) ;mRNA; f:12388-15494
MKKSGSGLGRALVRDKRKAFAKKEGRAWDRADALPPAVEEAQVSGASVTEVSDLQELLDTAALAGEQFAVEKQNVVVLSKSAITVPSLEHHDKVAAERATRAIKIPRRPQWTDETTLEELDKLERQSFLKWRRDLATVEEAESLVLTPFEKNLEMWRQLWRVLERSDAIVQIVDARDPLFFYSLDMVDYAGELGKTCLLLLNKADLLTERQRVCWARYLRSKSIRFMFFSALREQKRNEEATDTDSDSEGDASDDDVEEDEQDRATGEDAGELAELRGLARLYTCGDLMRLFNAMAEASAAGSAAPRITIGMVGYPNVGKSSTINALCGTKRVAVTSTPGKTKHFQTINLTETVTMCDCPGLVFPTFLGSKAEMVCNGILPIDQAHDWLSPVAIICQRIPHAVLCARYAVQYASDAQVAEAAASPLGVATIAHADEPTEAARFLSAIAAGRGFATARGTPDQSRAARIVLKDLLSGKLYLASPPPGVEPREFLPWRSSKAAMFPAQLADDPPLCAGADATARAALASAPKGSRKKSGAHAVQSGFAGRRKLKSGATGEEYKGTVHTAGRLGSDDFARPQWKHRAMIRVPVAAPAPAAAAAAAPAARRATTQPSAPQSQ